MKEIGYNVKCSKGVVIKLHDVCRSISTNEIVIIGEGVNKTHKIKGLVADNDVTGAGDWLTVYPDGELEVLCNLTDGTTIKRRSIIAPPIANIT